MSIELVLQCTGGGRLNVSGEWTPSSTLQQVYASVQSMLPPLDDDDSATLRYLQTSIPASQWSNTTLGGIGITEGRALLVLDVSPKNNNLESALQEILQNNFDEDSRACVETLIKVLDNIIQNPTNPKVRSIRLANKAFHQKVGQRKGGVQFLLACGFVRQSSPAPLLASTDTAGEATIVLMPQAESTTLLVNARNLLATRAVKDLNMTQEDLPKFKPPPPKTASNNSKSFNVYKTQRHDGVAAATGVSLGPDGTYVSPTETQLNNLKKQEKKLESSLQKPLEDRGLVAGLPNTTSAVASLSNATTMSGGGGDGSLLAGRFQKLQQDRKQREEGGFTTKAMRNLEEMKNKKVYSHASLKIQFADGSWLQAKFLPKERVQTVVDVMQTCFVSPQQFDLHVTPPRRKLDPTKTLQEEGLVPAARVFCSWKGNSTNNSSSGSVGSFLKPNLFVQEAPSAFPTAKPVSSTAKKASEEETKEESREDELMRRMMGGGRSSKKKSNNKKSAKPKWFKG